MLRKSGQQSGHSYHTNPSGCSHYSDGCRFSIAKVANKAYEIRWLIPELC